MIVAAVVLYLIGASALAIAIGTRLEQLHAAQARRDFYKQRVERDP